MSLTTRSDRWAIVAVALLTTHCGVCARLAGRRRRGRADRTTDEHGRTDDQRTRRGGPNAFRIPWELERTRADLVRVPVGAVRRRRRSPGRRRLHDRLGRDEPRSPARQLRRRLPHARARDGDERGRLSGRRVEPDGHRHRTAGQQVSALAARLDARRPGRDRRARHVDRQIADLVLVSLAALQLGGRRMPVDRGRRIAELSASPPTTSDASSASTSPHATLWDRRPSSRRSPPS